MQHLSAECWKKSKKQPQKIILVKFQTCINIWRLLLVVFSNKQLFTLIIQNTFAWLLLIIYTSSVIIVYPLLKSFNGKNNMQTIFTEISGEEISHVVECSEVFKGSVVQS